MSPPEPFNPFPGLRSFEPDEDHLFFGREAQTDELLRLLRTARFLAVVGTSGSGKSSLVRSGLIPALYGGAMSGTGSAWRVAVLRPGVKPISNLADALAVALGDAPTPPNRDFLEANLRASRLGLVESVCEAKLPAGDCLLVLADQFEELFRYRQSGREARDEALAFVRLLLEAARHAAAPVYIALTVRSEYFGHCMEFPDLPEAINEGLYLVPRMTRDQLRSAIAGPVAVGGGRIALRLIQRLLNDVGDNPDQLPVLQHALMRTWDRWAADHAEGEPLDLRHYDAVGTLSKALSQHADEAYRELDDRGKEIAETMFQALTEIGPEGHEARRPTTLRELCVVSGAGEAEVGAVVEVFRRSGRSFLTPMVPTGLDADSVLDLAHESLIRIWDRLRAWVKEEAQAGREFRDLAGYADRRARGIGALLHGVDLQVALAWRERERPTAGWASRYDPYYERAMAFLDESEAAQKRAVAEQERQLLIRQRLALALIMVLALATVSVSVFLRMARDSQSKALKAAAEASASDAKAQTEAARARESERKAQREQARAVESEGNARREADRAMVLEGRAKAETYRAEASELEAQRNLGFAREWANNADIERRRAIGSEEAWKLQKNLATSSAIAAEKAKELAERLKGLAEARGLAVRSLRLQDQDSQLAALLAVQAHKAHHDNRDGHEDESKGYADETDFYRSLYSSWKRLKPAKAYPEYFDLKVPVRGATFDPSGKTLVVGTEDGFVYSYPLPTGTRRPVRLFQSGVRSLAFGPSPEISAAGSLGGSLVVWKWRSSQRPALKLDGNKETGSSARGAVIALAFQRRGPWLAVGRAEGSIELWDWKKENTEGSRPLKAAGFSVASLALSDEGTLAAGGKGGILLWKNLPTPAAVKLQSAPDVQAIDLSRDGRFLVAGTAAGEVLLWDFAGGSADPTLLAEKGLPVRGVRLSADRKWLAAARGDGTVQLWETGRLQDPPLNLAGHKEWVWTLDFSADGEWLVSGSEDGTVRFWPLRLERLVEDVCGSLGKRELSTAERNRYLGGGGASPTCP